MRGQAEETRTDPGFRSAPSRLRVGLIGLGLIGTAVARRLLRAGFHVEGYDIDAGRREALTERGGTPAASLAALAATSDRLVLAVFDTQQVEDVVEGAGGLLESATQRTGAIYISVSTCDPERISALGERVASRGATLLECPLSGTSDQVAKGDAVGLVAGDAAQIDHIQDILTAICSRHYFLGALGNGNRAKLAINLILGLNRAALAEGLVFAERLGLDPQSFLELARGSAAYSQAMDVKGHKMVARDFSAHGKIAQSLKDFSLILDAARAAGQELPFAEVYRKMMLGCVEHGEADLDNSAIIEEIRRNALQHTTAGTP
jgi:3-hydroxyisobutyrate dehydrogenase-like beta-hydroxyacid dehydrogenase